MTIGYRDILAILLLLFYIPCLCAAIALIVRHGWSQSWFTWFVLVTFSLSRIAYASLVLASSAHPSSFGLRLAAATLAVDGLSPLLFMSIGLVYRLRGFLLQAQPSLQLSTALSHRHLTTLDALITAAFICASVGYRGMSRAEVDHGIATHSDTLKAAAIMYVIACAGVAAAAAALCAQYSRLVPHGERRVLLVLVAGLPLLCVRTVYLAVDILGDLGRFSAISGDVTIFLCMALLEECVMAGAYAGLGFVVRVISKTEWKEMQEIAKKKAAGKGEESGDGELLRREEGGVDLENGRGRA
ncbi:hypothetical protein GTA08_BOTSDO06401 [Botryosphaeria dothidea]|uniref:DUF7702 domain-containing protein n=1 Tax=Botryosphaeria dothidea TaxID=55169 RepID=A0A8H4IRW5_9PEZI|nr:hypothetical protein GTA08_BOTSDO06401 [Botryosphaeria dothidea]